jgi:hypothetical protein
VRRNAGLAPNGHVLATDADVTSPDATVADEARCHEARGIAGDGKAKPLRGKNRGRVHTDHLRTRRDERTTGVARIQCRIGLNDVVHQSARAGAERSADTTHDTGGCGVVKAEWIADGDRHLADSNATRVAESRPRQ